MNRREKLEEYVRSEQKSRLTSFMLTLLFGPFGVFYSSITGGIIFTILTIATAGSGIGLVVFWFLSIVFGDHFVCNYNDKVKKRIELLDL